MKFKLFLRCQFMMNQSVYIKQTVCTYLCTCVPLSLANCRTNLRQICTDLHTNSGKVLKTSLTPPTQPPDPGVPQTPKPKQNTREKLYFTKNALYFSRTAPDPGWLVFNKLQINNFEYSNTYHNCHNILQMKFIKGNDNKNTKSIPKFQ